jgi:hypothetical protein
MTQRSFLVPLLATLVLACAEEGVSTTDTTSSGGSNNAGAAGQGGAAGSSAGQGGSQGGSGGDSGTSGQGGESGTSGQAGSSTAGQGGSDAGSGGSDAGAGGSDAGAGGSDAGAGGSDAGAGGSGAGAGGGGAGVAGSGGSDAGAGGSDAAGSGGSDTAGAGGMVGAVCGGKTGKTCDKGAFCNVDGHCGYTDGTGTCEALPEACAEDCPGVCGCDGEFYCNACTAHAQGVSISESKDCLGAGGAGQGGSAGSGGSGGSTGAVCGGKTGKTCDKEAFCNVDGHCGYTDGTGTCEALPQGCTADCPGVCGCDGEFYCNACNAHAQGVSVSDSTSCLPAVDCSPFAAKLQPEFQMVGACTAVVRLDYTTKAILGYAVRCGKYSLTDEATARKAAVASTGFGASSKQIAGANPEDEYVFFQPPGDIGDVAAVHRRTGLAVFGGSIIGLGKGDISFPKEWRPASDLGKSCDNTKIMVPPARGFDLQDGATLPDKETEAALQVVWKTALPQAMAQANYIFDAMVLLYPRSVFAFDPATAEWIVLLNGGWLD